MSLRRVLIPPTPRPPPPGPPPPLNVEKPVEFSRRFGSVQSHIKLGPICGSASARIWIITPLVRLISSKPRRISGFCWSARITACSTVNLGEPFSDQPKLATSSVGSGDGASTIGDGPPRLVGTETVPAPPCVIVAVTLG